MFGARRSTVLLGASQDLVDRARRLGARDARPGPVAAPPLGPPNRSKALVRAELGAADRPIVLAVGRLALQKAYDVLLTLPRLWVRRPQPLVVIAGDGPEKQRLQDRIDVEAPPVRLLGHRSDMSDLLAAADIAVLPAHGRPGPLSLRRRCAPAFPWSPPQ